MRKLLARPMAFLSPAAWNGLAVTGYLGLLANSLAWPLWYSPGGPYPEWMLMKVLPLLLPLRGLLHGRRRTHQWASFLTLPYIMGSIAAIYGYLASPRFTTGMDLLGGVLQLALAGVMLAGCMYYAYATAGWEKRKAGEE